MLAQLGRIQVYRLVLASLLLISGLTSLKAQVSPRPPARPAATANPGYGNGPAYGNNPAPGYSAATSTVATTTSMSVLDDTRKLGNGDQVSFRVVEDRDPPVSLIVTDSGEMEVPYIGRIKASGRTCKALAQAVKSALEVDYYYRATVIIGLDLVNPNSRGRVYVTGEVVTQGSQELPAKEEFSASKAIANAGGISKFGNSRKIRILRKNASGTTDIIIFDYKKFQSGQGEDVILQPNDTINVQANLINFGGG